MATAKLFFMLLIVLSDGQGVLKADQQFNTMAECQLAKVIVLTETTIEFQRMACVSTIQL